MHQDTDASNIPLPLSPTQTDVGTRPSGLLDPAVVDTEVVLEHPENPGSQILLNSPEQKTIASDDLGVDERAAVTAEHTESAQAGAMPVDESLPSTGPPALPDKQEAPVPATTLAPAEQPREVQHGTQSPRSQTQLPELPSTPPKAHKRSLTLSRGHNVSIVLISSALEAIAASREAKRSTPLRDSTQRALDLVRSGEGGDHPREIFESLRLACETRNEKLMIASLDCISKLISYSFFAEPEHLSSQIPSPPPSPHPSGLDPNASQTNIPQPFLVDLVAHTITACHTENTPETVSLQIVKALLSLVLSPTVLVHHSSLLKAVRTVYNVFLLSSDPVNQMVAQGGLTQMVHHIFTRCRRDAKTPITSAIPDIISPDGVVPSRMSFSIPSEPVNSNANVDSGTDSMKSNPNFSLASLTLQRANEDVTTDEERNLSQINL